MDRRFLSQPDVVKASRNFVCIRLMTYESAAEARVLKTYWRPGSELENTVFVILDPNGRPLIRSSRSPKRLFRDSKALASTMDRFARTYNGRGQPRELPLVDTVRLGMNVAACDSRPLAIVVAQNNSTKRELEAKLAPYAWSKDYIGKLVYTTGGRNDLKGVIGASTTNGVVIVSPNTYGTRAKVIAQIKPTDSSLDIQRAFRTAISWRPPQKASSHRDHAREGMRQGARWETQIPVTDSHSLRAMQHRRR